MLGLLPGQLAPQLQEKLIRLGSWLPFEPAARLLTAFTGATASKATCRRLSEKAGQAQVGHQEAVVEAMEKGDLLTPESVPQKLIMSVDGAMVPLVGGEWAEVRTLAIGEVQVEKKSEGQPEMTTLGLSYFSRLTDAVSFQRVALVETERRGVLHAPAVASVNDGAKWIQQFIDYHRPDAIRILDFPHAAERFTTIYNTCRDKEIHLDDEWPAQQRHRLKEEGGTAVLATLRELQQTHPQVGLDEPISFLTDREKMLCYPHFRAHDWPIGSGAVESANKLVVEARLKGAGMHWRRDQVNPMLALRNIVCNERWDESWPDIVRGLRQKRKIVSTPAPPPSKPTPNLVQRYFKEMQRHHRTWEALQREAEKARPKEPWKPAPDHPWRQDWRPHRRSAKK